jgi:hypothetical protein
MERSETTDAIASPAPVFVDDTGRRRALTRRAGRVVLVGFVGYLGLLGAGFARDPRLGPMGLPTFGLPALHPEPVPVVLGQTTARTAAEGTGAGEDKSAVQSLAAGRTGGPSGQGVPGDPTGAAVAGQPAGPIGRPAPAPASGQGSAPTTSSTTTTTTGPTHPGNSPKSTTTTTTTVPASSPTTTPTTTPTTSPTPGQGSGSAAAKGPDGAGPPGQDRKATTTTTTPKR